MAQTPFQAAKLTAAHMNARMTMASSHPAVVWSKAKSAEQGRSPVVRVVYEGGYEWPFHIDAWIDEDGLAVDRDAVWTEPENGYMLNFYPKGA